MNRTATSEQLRKAKEDFLKRTEPFMNELAKLAKLKKPILQYDLTTNFYSFEFEKDTKAEENLKKIIRDIRDDISANLDMY